MILSAKKGTIKRPSFDGILIDKTGATITNFIVNPVADETGTTLDGYRVSMSSDTAYVVGDEVLIVEPDGIERQNVIEGVGIDVLQLQDRLTSFDSGVAITVKPNFVSIELNITEDGIYYFSDHEALIVSDTYFAIDVPYGIIADRFQTLPRDANMPLKNKDAKEAIFAEFSFDPLFFRKLDMGQLTELVKLKILAILESTLPPEYIKHQTNYDNFKNSMVNLIEVTIEGELDPDVFEDPDAGTFNLEFDWGE